MPSNPEFSRETETPRQRIEDLLDVFMGDPKRIPPRDGWYNEPGLPIRDRGGKVLGNLLTTSMSGAPLVIADLRPEDQYELESFHYPYGGGEVVHIPSPGLLGLRGEEAAELMANALESMYLQWEFRNITAPDYV